MASPDLTAAQVMDSAAAALNDVNKTTYSYAVQIPYLNMALRELQEEFERAEVPVTDEKSAVIEVDAAAIGIVEIGFAPTPPIANTPYLPNDLITPKILWESPRGLNQWVTVVKLDTLPEYMLTAQINQFLYYQWASQQIKVLAANADNDLKLDYTRSLFTTVGTSTDQLNIVNGFSYLSMKTAANVARFVEENKDRADSLDIQALLGLDRALGIETKGRQAILTRRQPFRSGYKRRNQ